MNEVNLRDAIFDAKNIGGTLTDWQQTELMALLGSGCRKDTKARLSRRLAVPLSLWPYYGIFERVTLSPIVEYVPGQSYPDEIRTVRQLILEG